MFMFESETTPLFETFSCSTQLILPEESKLFLEKRFPAENVFDICFGLTSALGINEKAIFFFSFFQEFITSVDIYPLWMEMAADICDTTHEAYRND